MNEASERFTSMPELSAVTIDRPLAEGQAGTIWRGVWSQRADIAVKPLHCPERRRPRLAFEVLALTPIDHPALPRVRDVRYDANWAFVLSDLVPGAPLGVDPQPDPRHLAAGLADVAGALAALHRRGLGHGAVSARKVLLDGARGYLVGLPRPVASTETLGPLRVPPPRRHRPAAADVVALVETGLAASRQLGGSGSDDLAQLLSDALVDGEITADELEVLLRTCVGRAGGGHLVDPIDPLDPVAHAALAGDGSQGVAPGVTTLPVSAPASPDPAPATEAPNGADVAAPTGASSGSPVLDLLRARPAATHEPWSANDPVVVGQPGGQDAERVDPDARPWAQWAKAGGQPTDGSLPWPFRPEDRPEPWWVRFKRSGRLTMGLVGLAVAGGVGWLAAPAIGEALGPSAPAATDAAPAQPKVPAAATSPTTLVPTQPGPPASAPASIAPPSSAAPFDPLTTMRGLSEARAAAINARDEAALAHAHAPGSPAWVTDAALLERLAERGHRIEGLKIEVSSATHHGACEAGATPSPTPTSTAASPQAAPECVALQVVTRMTAHQVVTGDGTANQIPAAEPQTNRLHLIATPAGWRVWEVQ